MSFNNIKKIWKLADLGRLDGMSSIEYDVLIGAMSYANNETGMGIESCDATIAKRILRTRATVTKALNKLINKGYLLCRTPGCRHTLDINVRMLDDSLEEDNVKPKKLEESTLDTKLVEPDCSYGTLNVPIKHITNPDQTFMFKLKQGDDKSSVDKSGKNVSMDLSSQERDNYTLVRLLREHGCYDGLIVSLMTNYSHGSIYYEAVNLIERIQMGRGKPIYNFGGALKGILINKHAKKVDPAEPQTEQEDHGKTFDAKPPESTGKMVMSQYGDMEELWRDGYTWSERDNIECMTLQAENLMVDESEKQTAIKLRQETIDFAKLREKMLQSA